MRYVAAALTVYKLDQTLKQYVEAPPWAFTVAITGASLLVTYAFRRDPRYAVAVAAGAELLSRFDTLLMTASDAAKVSVLRNTRR
jgi:hypothetical protein